jgi:HlyD family secretion protein
MTSAGPVGQSIRRHLLVGSLVSLGFVGAVGGWSATAELAGAVVAPGHLVVESNVKKVQHPTGGIVGELNVRDGDHVNAGDVVVRLDETQTKANLAVLTKGLEELHARSARLEAEKTAAVSISFPDELLSRERADAVVARLLEGERKLFGLRSDARNGQKAQLRERTAQLREEIGGLAEQISAKSEELTLVQEELRGLLDLWEKHLVAITRVSALKREAARLEGERGQLIAAKAAANGKISETELQIIQIDADAWSKAAEELSEVRAKISELSERKVAAEDQLKRVDIIAPQTGRVHQLTVHTIGGVIEPGETIMLIVPENDSLSVEAKVAPNDIDQLEPHQAAMLRFSAFSQRTTPELNGTISWISADLSEDARTGSSYYTVRIAVSEQELARLKGLKIVPGMPVEAFIQTGNRTVLSYLLKPLSDQVMRAFRES